MEHLERKSFVFYRSFFEAMQLLPEEHRLHVYDMLCKYALNGECPVATDANGVEIAMFMLIKPQLDANTARYESGGRGGRPSKRGASQTVPEPNRNQAETIPEPNRNQAETIPEPNRNQAETIPEPNVNVNDNVNANDNGNVDVNANAQRDCAAAHPLAALGGTRTTTTTTTPPTVESVESYCREQGYSIDAQHFVDYYAAKGWMVGRNPMRDWKAVVRNWARNQSERDAPADTSFDTGEHSYDLADFEKLMNQF